MLVWLCKTEITQPVPVKVHTMEGQINVPFQRRLALYLPDS
jgi:hypothetical protein